MPKPIFRYTVGNCLKQGLEVLVESVHRTTKALGVDVWDWVICYNGLNTEELSFLRSKIGHLPIKFFSQNWATCPIKNNCQTPRRPDGSFEYNGKRCGGTMWKVCPPRMRMDTHEIVVDNDVVILKKFCQLEEWLRQKEKVLILEEPIRFYGRYDHLFAQKPPFLNSGFMGYPPSYNFGEKINYYWEKFGSFENLSQADEQGLLMYVLSQEPSMRIHQHQMVECLHRDYKTKMTGNEESFHFVQSNRIPNHHLWNKYLELMKNK
jgi:hypothetical protein